MDERAFVNNEVIFKDKEYQKVPMRSNLSKEVSEFEERFGMIVVGIIFQKKESGSPDFTVDFIVDKNENSDQS